MNLPIAIVAGEPNSISSEIIFKAWKLRKKFIHKPWEMEIKYQEAINTVIGSTKTFLINFVTNTSNMD